MHIQRGLKKDSSLKKFVIGAHPIIKHFLELLTVHEIVGTYMQSDKRMRLDNDKITALLIHHILTTPHPLYEIQDWLNSLDAGPVGLAPEDPQYVQDDRMVRALVRFYHSRHQEVFFRLALRAIKLFELDCTQLHQDTTTITFAGKYPGWCAQELLTNGINKGHRPDLKQLVLGLTVTAAGSAPLLHRIYDGNQTDDRLHPANHRRLRKLLQRVDFISVADCKLATEENLQKLSAWGGLFVTVMPRTMKKASRSIRSERSMAYPNRLFIKDSSDGAIPSDAICFGLVRYFSAIPIP
ncbi:MAG: IS1634 family transposase [Candidatus Omnitrophota bacterium]|jgi:transposase|nr:MAG: IS1634 family transposase [Candidatus Omnitrophota bacterium]